MKLLLIFLLAGAVSAQAQPNGFSITGNVTGAPAKTIVSLTDLQNPTDTLTKATLLNGKFVLKGTMKEPALYYLNFAQPGKKSIIFLDNSNITVTGNLNNVQKLTVKGSQTNSDFELFQNTFDPLIGRYNALAQKAQAVGMNDTLVQGMGKATTEIQTAIDAFVDSKKSSYVTPFMLLVTYQLADVTTVENRFAKLDPVVQQSNFGRYLKENVIDAGKIGAVGTPALEFTQNDTTGVPVSLSSFRGKYVLIDFWASWCGPCRQENPNVVANYLKFKDKNFTVLGVSLDRSRDNWLKAIKDDRLTWTHVSDLKFWNNEVAAKYHIQQIPQNLLIDPNGKIVAKNLRGGVLQATLCELLGCN